MSDTTEPEVQPSATPEMPERVEIPSDEEVFGVWEGEAEGGDPRAVFDGSDNDGSDHEGLAEILNDYKENGSSLLVSTDPAGKDMEPTNSSDDDDAPIRGTGALHDDSDDDIFIENSSKGPELLSRLRRGNAGTSKQPARVNSPSSDDDEHQPTPPTQPAQPILPVPEPSELPEPELPEESSASADSCQLNGSLDGPQADAVATPTGADGAEVGVSRKRTAQNAPSASGSERRRGKKLRHAAKHAAARLEQIEKSTEEEDGGYALKAKGQARREGVAFAVAKAGEEDRTCMADAVYVLLCTLAVVATKEAVRAALPATEQKDPDQKMAKQFAIDHGVDLVHQPRLTGSPMSLLRETTGTFLVRLKLTVADGSADFHYVAFDAARALIIDNAPRVKFPEINEEDLRDNRSAIRPFYHLFPNATDIRIASVLKGVVAA